MNTEKMKVTKEQAKRIKHLSGILTISEILKANMEYWSDRENHCLNGMSVEDMATALIVGYEVEKTPEEQILELYNNHLYKGLDNVQANAVLSTVKNMLSILDMKVKGIND